MSEEKKKSVSHVKKDKQGNFHVYLRNAGGYHETIVPEPYLKPIVIKAKKKDK